MEGIIMEQDNVIDEQLQPKTFADKWHEERLLKRSKKKARKQLEKQGYSNREASSMVKQAVKNISSNKPARKTAGRGR
jgi:hypothetical protein